MLSRTPTLHIGDAPAVDPEAGKTTTASTSKEDLRCTYNEKNSPEQPTPGQIAESDKETYVEDPAEASDTPFDADDAAPDGGVAAWLVVLGAWCASFCGYGWVNSIGTFQEYYESGPLKDYTASQISWIPSMQIFFMSALGPVIGGIHDRYGIRLLVAVGSFMHVFGLMMASLSSSYYQFMLSQGVCSSVGVASVFICAISTVSGWFDKHRGLAFGVMATGSSLGGVVFPIMISNLIRTVGYGWAMRSAAFIILVLLIVSNMTLRMRAAPSRSTVSPMSMTRPFRERPFQLLLVGLFLVPFGLYVPINYMPVAAIGAGFPKDLSQNLVVFYNAASLVGRLSSGYLSDRFGRFNIFIISCYLAGILILAMWIPAHAEGVVIAFSVLFGLFSGAYISLMGALVAQISPPEEIGYRNGLTFLFSAVGGLTTSPIAGAILQTPASWNGLKIFAGVMLVAGTTGVFVVRTLKTGLNLRAIF